MARESPPGVTAGGERSALDPEMGGRCGKAAQSSPLPHRLSTKVTTPAVRAERKRGEAHAIGPEGAGECLQASPLVAQVEHERQDPRC